MPRFVAQPQKCFKLTQEYVCSISGNQSRTRGLQDVRMGPCLSKVSFGKFKPSGVNVDTKDQSTIPALENYGNVLRTAYQAAPKAFVRLKSFIDPPCQFSPQHLFQVSKFYNILIEITFLVSGFIPKT